MVKKAGKKKLQEKFLGSKHFNMSNICIVSVIVGEKYKKFAELFCKSYHEKIPSADRQEIVFVVENLDGCDITKYDNVTVETLPEESLNNVNSTKTFGTGTVRNFDYSLKRFGYQSAIDKGYTDICFIDTDMTVRDEWDMNVFEACDKPGLWAGRGYPSSGFGTKPVTLKEDVRFTPKLTSLKKELQYETDWVNYRMPFEAVMYLTGVDKPTIQEFINKWKYVSDATKKLNLPKNKVTHEIGLAADMCKIPVYFNQDLLSVLFKHYIMNHQVLLDLHANTK